MKKIVALLLVMVVVAVTSFADPIGLTVQIDNFGFGNVAAKDYKFAGTGGKANVTPSIDFKKAFGAITVAAGLRDTITFGDPLEQKIRLHVKGTYALPLSEASKLSFSVYDKFFLYGNSLPTSVPTDTTNPLGEKFADADSGQIENWIGPAVRFDQTLGFGTIYAVVELNININFAEGAEIALDTGDDDGFKVGIEKTSFGVWGYIQPVLALRDLSGETPTDVLTWIKVRVGYPITPSLGARVTFEIPTIENGFDTKGLTIQPRITYSDIIPNLGAYADFKIAGVGSNGDIAFTPAIGVSYAF
jgi:hypothetical protein